MLLRLFAEETSPSSQVAYALLQNDSYYEGALDVMARMRSMYPAAAFWVVGHSLGGSLASLMGLTLDLPSVSFEAPPERLPAQRLGLLPWNASRQADRATAYHFGNTADPVYMGACNGFFSSCS